MVCHASELQGQSFVCILYVGRNVYISYNDNGVRGFVVFAVCIIFSYDSLSICTKKHRIHRKIISDHTGNQHDLFNGYHSVPTDKYMGGLKIPENVGVHLHGGETMGELVETQAAAAGVTFHRERAGGTISFTSEEGVGTTFTIEFRFLLAPETEKGDNSKDNTMQDFQGTQQIRAMHRPDAATIPIIAMTANAFADDIQQSKEAGMSEHLSKPLDEQKMFAMIRKYCREKKEGENQ